MLLLQNTFIPDNRKTVDHYEMNLIERTAYEWRDVEPQRDADS